MSRTKSKKTKYYAIKEGKGVSNIVVTTWEECSKLVLGYNAVYKSFLSREEADDYLGIVTVKKVKEQMRKSIRHRRVNKGLTISLSIEVPKELYEKFQNKCIEFETTEEKVLLSMIKEWLDFNNLQNTT